MPNMTNINPSRVTIETAKQYQAGLITRTEANNLIPAHQRLELLANGMVRLYDYRVKSGGIIQR